MMMMMMMMVVVVKSISSFFGRFATRGGSRRKNSEKLFCVFCVLFSRQKHTHKRGHFRHDKNTFLSFLKDETR